MPTARGSSLSKTLLCDPVLRPLSRHTGFFGNASTTVATLILASLGVTVFVVAAFSLGRGALRTFHPGRHCRRE